MSAPSRNAAAWAGRMPGPDELADWPAADRRGPVPSDRDYLMLRSLVDVLKAEIATRLGKRRDLRVLDLGCGEKPYLPLFAGLAASYRGLDMVPGPLVDDVGSL